MQMLKDLDNPVEVNNQLDKLCVFSIIITVFCRYLPVKWVLSSLWSLYSAGMPCLTLFCLRIRLLQGLQHRY